MRKPDQSFEDLERSLSRLMPVALGEGARERMDTMIDSLARDAGETGSDFRNPVKWLVCGGVAAALAIGAYVAIPHQPVKTVSQADETAPELIYLSEADRVEGVSDEGLFVDSGGSAVRKVRVRVVEESRVRDEETGIVVMLTEPREEMYMVPVSTF